MGTKDSPLRYGVNPLQRDYCLAASSHCYSNSVAAEHMGGTHNMTTRSPSHQEPAHWHHCQGFRCTPWYDDPEPLRCDVPYPSSSCPRYNVFIETDKASVKTYGSLVFYRSSV